jgi:hypothetical protein
MVEVGSINFGTEVIMNFGEGFWKGECSLIIGIIIRHWRSIELAPGVEAFISKEW